MSSIANFAARNIQLLAEKQPELAQRLKDALGKGAGNEIKVYPSKKGGPAAEIPTANGPMHLCSRYDPITEARRLTSSYKIAKTVNVVAVGFGMGYHIEELARQSDQRDVVLVVEKSLDIFCAAIKSRDLSWLIKRPNISFSIDEGPMKIFGALKYHSLTIKANGISLVKHPPSVKLFENYYQQVFKTIDDIYVWASVNINAQINSGKHYTANIIRNLPEVARLPGIGNLFGAFDGKPGIVVAAGPSLNKNISLIKEAKNRAVIIAVDTALKPLLNHGIRPDFVVSIDFTPHNERYFTQIDTEGLCLVSDCEIYPPILKNFEGRKFISNIPDKAICAWYTSVIGDRGSMGKGLSVAHTAFELAFNFGCDPIVLTGQDLAYTGGLSHAAGTSMARVEEREATLEIGDIFGRPVSTSISMNVFLKHLEELIADCYGKREFKCIDATEGGAKIRGTGLMPLEHVLAEYCRGEICPEEVIEAAQGDVGYEIADNLTRAAGETVGRLRRMQRLTTNACASLNRIKNNLTSATGSPNRLRQLQDEFNSVSSAIKSEHSLLDFMRDNIMKELVLQATKEETPISEIDFKSRIKLMPTVEKCITINSGIGSAARYLEGLMDELADQLSPTSVETA
jgi:hypothetical protein